MAIAFGKHFQVFHFSPFSIDAELSRPGYPSQEVFGTLQDYNTNG